LNGFLVGENIVLIASSFGGVHNPAWYYNLKQNPECDVEMKGHSGRYTAHETEPAERETYWQLALTYYLTYEKYREWAAPYRRIPIMLLTPLK